MNKSVNITGFDTSKIKILSSKDTYNLFVKYQQGDLQAKEELIYGNLKLVLSLVKKFNNSKFNLDDLFQVGVIGLIKAIDNFDLSYDLKLSTYAVPLILGEIKRYVRDSTPLRISRSIKDIAYRILKYKEEYYNMYGKELSNEELSKEFSLSEYGVANALDSLKEPVSIYEPIYSDGGDTIYLLDQLADKSNKVDKDTLIGLNNALKMIKKREREVLLSRYIVGKTQIEIADDLKISQAQVSRIERNAISNVKKLIK